MKLSRDEFVELVAACLGRTSQRHQLEVLTIPGWPGYMNFARCIANALDEHEPNWMPRQPRVGDRCEIVRGFSTGATGTVVFIEPQGAVWLQRDYASTPTKHTQEELEIYNEVL